MALSNFAKNNKQKKLFKQFFYKQFKKKEKIRKPYFLVML